MSSEADVAAPGIGLPPEQEAEVQAGVWRRALDNLRALLEANGATLQHVVKVTLYLQKLKYRTAFHKVWMEYFPENPPARIPVDSLADRHEPHGRMTMAGEDDLVARLGTPNEFRKLAFGLGNGDFHGNNFRN